MLVVGRQIAVNLAGHVAGRVVVEEILRQQVGKLKDGFVFSQPASSRMKCVCISWNDCGFFRSSRRSQRIAVSSSWTNRSGW